MNRREALGRFAALAAAFGLLRKLESPKEYVEIPGHGTGPLTVECTDGSVWIACRMPPGMKEVHVFGVRGT